MNRQQPQQGMPPRPQERPMIGPMPYYPTYNNYPSYICYPYYYQPGHVMYPPGTAPIGSQTVPSRPPGRPQPGYTPQRPGSGTR